MPNTYCVLLCQKILQMLLVNLWWRMLIQITSHYPGLNQGATVVIRSLDMWSRQKKRVQTSGNHSMQNTPAGTLHLLVLIKINSLFKFIVFLNIVLLLFILSYFIILQPMTLRRIQNMNSESRLRTKLD